MKNQTKLVLSIIAFAAIVSLQSFILYQQNKTNLALHGKIDQMQIQLNETSKTNSALLSKIKSIESNLALEPRQLLSMN
tara:strand:- start:214 stop:450 length:237 start_codon:yes stop_codon:yes gene_type:complete